MNDAILSVRDLRVGFDTDAGFSTAVDGASFDLREGEVLGLVGESGSGKSVTALSLLRLVPTPPGKIISGTAMYNGTDLLSAPPGVLRSIRGRKISLIFQEPMTALSPLMPVGKQLTEALHLHQEISSNDAQKVAEDWLARVRMPDPKEAMHRFPHQLSGGMRQRVMIAMALMHNPDIIIADEPTTALDVTVQAQIFDLLLEVKSAKSSIIFITHDMGAVWEMCTRVLVMQAGKIVEEGPVREVLICPTHPYTQGLLQALSGMESL